MKYYVAGAKGMLASDLVPLLETRGEVAAKDLPELDISDIESVRKSIVDAMPDMVINCAAYTAVDKAEEEKDIARAVNAEGAGNLAIICKERGVRLVHISTDFVFDGESARPYREEDAAAPINVYGKTKLEGERLIARSIDDYLIVRTSWLYGRHGNNFVKTISRLVADRETLGIVYDQTGTPTYTGDLAEAIINLIDAGANPGVYHFSNEGVCSWYDFAHEIIRLLEIKGGVSMLKELRPILSKDYPTPAARPAYSVLDKSKYKKATSKTIPHWRDSLVRYFDEETSLLK